ncbi:NepR family anti-sigma factor [Sphingopyxis sp. BSNA05]|uniref:NepR family anti-sigma factor n=1 Tax=Sphingopyxis sp. BSNA05 TaxID=1236614 RepID=UPI001C273262|nr:NepR family anti-sigma factor [Sphingopyxis sp. BSNA05]
MTSQTKDEAGTSGSSEPDDAGQRSKDMPVKNKEDMQERLGLGLKDMYSSVLDEPLPDDMLALLDQLEANDTSDVNSSRPDDNE